ncbi:MAG: flagellar hook basal-body protein [Candidatus Melainabacteria bacterium]|nr:flagellar hook basal-body protein [Candidatus Melainabacteria bacterium]
MSNQPNSFGPTIQGMLHKLKMIQIIAGNISNASSIGYQRQIPESLSFRSVLNEAAMRDASQGELKKTGDKFDLAIEGNAYFLIDTKDGIIPTRNGKFRLNEKGELSTQDGHEVVVIEKTDKDISLAKDFDIRIDQNGEIHVGTERYGRIAMQILDNKPVKVHQGFVEGSNVSIENEMVSLAMAFRSFEASEKLLGMEASVDRDLIEKYGRNV